MASCLINVLLQSEPLAPVPALTSAMIVHNTHAELSMLLNPENSGAWLKAQSVTCMSLCFGLVLGIISGEIFWRCWRMPRSHECFFKLFLSKKKSICGLILGAESRVQETNLLFANLRAHASPDCRMSLSASAEPPLCVMSSKAIFGCSPSIFDRKPRSKVEIPLLRDCKNDCIFHFTSSHSDRRTKD